MRETLMASQQEREFGQLTKEEKASWEMLIQIAQSDLIKNTDDLSYRQLELLRAGAERYVNLPEDPNSKTFRLAEQIAAYWEDEDKKSA